MQTPQLKKINLYEGLDHPSIGSMLLWETAGHSLKEAALTSDQIQQLFQQIEQSATASGSNRTALGKGKDAASAVNKAWNDLKGKIQNSKPVEDFDQKVSDILSKIGMGAEDPKFNGQVSSWVQKYRKFAKERPILQGAIYATLIALAGITGAGIGGAVALGLLKMADQLLQGKRASSAAYSGLKAGAMAFAASKLGDLIKGAKPGEQIPVSPEDSAAWQAVKRDFQNYDYYMHPSNNSVIAVPKGMGNPFDPSTAAGAARDQLRDMSAGAIRDQARSIADRAVEDALKSGVTRPNELADAAAMAMEKANIGTNVGGKLSVQTVERIADQAAGAARDQLRGAVNQSYDPQGKKLSEGQIYMIFNRIAAKEQLTEGPLDFIKGAVTKGKEKLQTVGKNLTTKITADKLNKAWQTAGSPMDSEEIAKVLTAAGVGDDVVKSVYADLKIPAAGSAADTAAMSDADLDKLIDQLNTKQKKEIMKYLQQQLGTA